MSIRIGSRVISQREEPFIIAEMSANHNQSLECALAIVDAVAKAGAHALKLQTYTPETMTLNSNHPSFQINQHQLWKEQNLYQLYSKAYTPWEWHKPIFNRCKELGIIGFSSPFDETAVDFLESLNVPCYKVASFENTDLPLIEMIAKTRKPIILSTGLATIGEIEEAVRLIQQYHSNIILLKCTSTYPASPKNTNILTIPHMQNTFNCEVGLSDHTIGFGTAVSSIALGATVIEKHVKLSDEEGGLDSAFSITPDDLKILVEETKRAWQSLGTIHYGPTEDERDSLYLRRSLYIVKDIKEGEVITKNHIKSIRPGYGVEPKFKSIVIGKIINRDVERGTPFQWDFI